MSHFFTQIPSDFIDDMIDKNNLLMLGAFCEYARDVQKNRVYTVRDYAKQWFGDYAKVSSAHKWIVKFKANLESFRISKLKINSEQEVNKTRTRI